MQNDDKPKMTVPLAAAILAAADKLKELTPASECGNEKHKAIQEALLRWTEEELAKNERES